MQYRIISLKQDNCNFFYDSGVKWLFWFCEGLACVSGKTKCATCVLEKIVL